MPPPHLIYAAQQQKTQPQHQDDPPTQPKSAHLEPLTHSIPVHHDSQVFRPTEKPLVHEPMAHQATHYVPSKLSAME